MWYVRDGLVVVVMMMTAIAVEPQVEVFRVVTPCSVVVG
jgi:hypothetical protein